jgi:hypothetical protein
VKASLFDAPRRGRWTGSRALVALPLDRCPVDQLPLVVSWVAQPALFRHGGYGATFVSLVRSCRCGWSLVAQTQETNPRRAA